MTTSVFRFSFASHVLLSDAEASLLLAAVAAEGLFGETAVRIDFDYFADAPRRALLIDASTTVGVAIVRMFARLLTREFGGTAFDVRRVSVPRPGSAAA